MEYRHQRRVSFSDTDAGGLVHFSRLLCYAEEAEHALLEQLGIPLLGDGGWPRVQVNCNYSAPVFPGETVEVVTSPNRLGGSSIDWKFQITRGETLCASGVITTVRVNSKGKPVQLEDAWREKLGK
ncbi:hypothetical protein NT6N_09860 [Oceaniferula spumae]|uniref:Thioesterase domain-containing protein n=1 Tax=Oceaniferula spumae TaxID=2979115 RepID=A0AAT9FIQ1_9BACT